MRIIILVLCVMGVVLGVFLYKKMIRKGVMKDSPQKSSEWLLHVKQATATKKTGQFTAQDKSGAPVILEWTVTDVRSSNFSVLQKNICNIVVAAFAQVEIQFLKVHPEEHDAYCQSFEPLFRSGPTATDLQLLKQALHESDWQLAEEKMQLVLRAIQVMDHSNFGIDDVHCFVLVKDGMSKKLLGYATFYIMPQYQYGDIKITGIALAPTEQNRGLGKLLMSSILKIIPETKRIINCAHPTNDKALGAYQNWGFVLNPNPIAEPHMPINKKQWVYLIYNVEQTDILQKTAAGLVELNEEYATKVLNDALAISGNVIVQRLQGGFSGASLFTATVNSKKYVIRFLMHKSIEERKKEITILQIASKNGYGPEIYYANIDQGVIIMEFLQQQPIEQQLMQSDNLYKHLAKFLQKIHRGPAFERIEERDVFNSISAIIKNLNSKNCPGIPLVKLKNIVANIHQAATPYLLSVPCHNDLHPSNLLFLGDRFKAVDYERATQADPYFDLAMVAYAYCEKPDYEIFLLSIYLGRQPTNVEITKLYLFKIIAWTYCAVCFLTMIPEQLPNYETLKVPVYEDLFKEFIDLERPENKLRFAKVLINHVIANVESQEFTHAMLIMTNNRE